MRFGLRAALRPLFLLLPLLSFAACELPLAGAAENPLIGTWDLVSAPGVGWHGPRRITFESGAMRADRQSPKAVQHYEITRTKVHLHDESGQVLSYRVIDVGFICQEPPPEKIFRNFPPFDEKRVRQEACYRRDFSADQPAGDDSVAG